MQSSAGPAPASTSPEPHRTILIRTITILVLMASISTPALAQQIFTNVTASAGISGQNGLGHAVGWADVNNDGHQDLAFSNQDGSDFWFYANNGDGTFADLTVAAGLGSAGADKILWAELTGDDDVDLLLSASGCRLYRNNGDVTFSNITGASGLSGSPEGVCDVDRDGLVDVITSSSSVLRWHPNLGGGLFDVPHTIGPVPSPWACVCFDFDLDGDDDIYVGSYGSTPNQLYRNDGDGTFTDVAAAAGVDFPHASHGLAVGDQDNDGWPDLYVGGYSSQRCRLFRNLGDGTFADVTTAAGVLGYPDTRTVSFVDFDNDGWLDIFASHHDFYSYSNVMWHNQGDGTYTDVAVALGLSGEWIGDYFGVGWADFDRDGATDLFAAGHIDKYRLFRNDQCPGHFLQLTLVGTQSNRSAIGARASVYAGGESWMRQVVPGSGERDGHGFPLQFGLGSHAAVDSVVIHWPSGLVQKLGALVADQLLTVTEVADMTGIEGETPAPSGFDLAAAPNPFNPATSLSFNLPDGVTRADLSIHDLRGRLVRHLVVAIVSGTQQVRWDGREDSGQRVASGRYLARLTVDGRGESLGLVLVQ